MGWSFLFMALISTVIILSCELIHPTNKNGNKNDLEKSSLIFSSVRTYLAPVKISSRRLPSFARSYCKANKNAQTALVMNAVRRQTVDFAKNGTQETKVVFKRQTYSCFVRFWMILRSREGCPILKANNSQTKFIKQMKIELVQPSPAAWSGTHAGPAERRLSLG